MPVFQLFYEMKLKTSKFKVLAFWGLIPALWNIGILLHKQTKRRTIMHTTVHLKQTFTEGEGDGIESRLPFKIFSTLESKLVFQ